MADLLRDLERIRDERKDATLYVSEHETRQNYWRNHKDRLSRVDAFARGDWHIVFPDSSAVVEMPKVPNIVQLKISDAAALASSVQPSLRCDPANERSRPRAEKRERIAEFYRKQNNVALQSSRYFIDLMMAGVGYKLVLPDFASGFPLIRRIDPRWAWPDTTYTPERRPKNFLVSYERSRAALAAENEEIGLPARNRQGNRGESEMVTVIEWYDGTEFIRVAAIKEKEGTRQVMLARAPNLLDRVPVVIGAIPTFDGQFRGAFDQTLGVLESNNRILNLMLDAAADWVGGQPIEYNIENAEDWGTGTVLHSRTADGYMRRIQPDGASGQLFGLLQQTMGHAREAAVFPEARSGQVEQSIASAAFVSAITGNVSTEMAHLQRIEASAWSEALSIAFEVDEKYHDSEEPKYIVGSRNNRRFSESYKPSVDIKGDYGIRAEFGGAAGGDQFSFEIRLNQAAGSGLVSRKTAMEKHSLVDDVVNEEKQLLKERLLQAGMQFIAAQAQQGNFAPGSQLIEALEEDDETQLTVLARLGEVTQPPQQQQPQQGPAGTEAFTEAAGLARGGIAPETNVPGEGALPSLEELGIGA